jgi:hypothetical protein
MIQKHPRPLVDDTKASLGMLPYNEVKFLGADDLT